MTGTRVLAAIGLASVLLTGCATAPSTNGNTQSAQSTSGNEQSAQPTSGNEQSATFRHPTTGDVKTCTENPNTGAAWALICIPCWVTAYKNEYASCKTGLEEAGYGRVSAADAR